MDLDLEMLSAAEEWQIFPIVCRKILSFIFQTALPLVTSVIARLSSLVYENMSFLSEI